MSGSEVVLLEDEAESPARKAKGRKKAADDAESISPLWMPRMRNSPHPRPSRGSRGAARRRGGRRGKAVAAPAGAYRPVPWGPRPRHLLSRLAFPFMLIGGIMGYQLIETMWGYQQPRKPTAPLVQELAKTLDMELRDQ